MATRSRLIAVAVAVISPVLLLPGCGGGAPPSILIKADLIRRADAICEATTTKIGAVAQPGANSSATEDVAYAQHVLPLLDDAVAKLSALPAAPVDYVVLDQNLIQPTKAQTGAAHAFVTAVQQANGDATGMQAALAQYVGSFLDQSQHQKALSDFGFTTCARGTGAAPPPTTTTTTTTPPSFLARDAHFAAVFPVTPTRSAVPVKTVAGTVQGISYSAVTADESLTVFYLQFPGAVIASRIAAALDKGVADLASGVGGTVTSNQHITFLGSPAVDAVVNSPGHIFHMRAVIVARNFFQIQGVTLTTDSPHPQYDELLATFRTI